MIKVGLTGNIGSGKTIVSNIFKVLRVPVYNADLRARVIMEKPEIINKISVLLGNEILDENGIPDKKKIAAIVFNDKSKLEKLNHIIHPLVIADFEKWIKEQSGTGYVIMESAILFETGYNELFDKIIFISAPETLRVKRVMMRDGVNAVSVKSRIKQQLPEKNKISKADFVIVNNERKLLIPQVLKVNKEITES
ncbi:MAG TPA: dephospho-CoA kinase [Bacteroidales bacterium]|nr:dephospho-CoA kinase [Bacteroidales bacterium]HPS17381.1 dephospho-CoA kinase [Bacteroidales bacterium]